MPGLQSLQHIVGDLQITLAAADRDMRLVGTVEVAAAAGQQAEFRRNAFRKTDGIRCVGGMCSLHAKKARLDGGGEKAAHGAREDPEPVIGALIIREPEAVEENIIRKVHPIAAPRTAFEVDVGTGGANALHKFAVAAVIIEEGASLREIVLLAV